MENSKSEIRNSKQISKSNLINSNISNKEFDLEERTFNFAESVRIIVKKLPRTSGNLEDIPQLVRASGSQEANYIEANESISKKDFIFRIKICRKEAKESRFWLRLVDVGMNLTLDEERKTLIQEATELMMIFGSIFRKTQK